jgi:serine/threonine protein kinase
MERCDGTLADYLVQLRGQGRDMEAKELIEIMIHVLTGLRHCHDRNVCHRDLKLSNSIPFMFSFSDLTSLISSGELPLSSFAIRQKMGPNRLRLFNSLGEQKHSSFTFRTRHRSISCARIDRAPRRRPNLRIGNRLQIVRYVGVGLYIVQVGDHRAGWRFRKRLDGCCLLQKSQWSIGGDAASKFKKLWIVHASICGRQSQT